MNQKQQRIKYFLRLAALLIQKFNISFTVINKIEIFCPTLTIREKEYNRINSVIILTFLANK